jgi:hypothetical protein
MCNALRAVSITTDGNFVSDDLKVVGIQGSTRLSGSRVWSVTCQLLAARRRIDPGRCPG